MVHTEKSDYIKENTVSAKNQVKADENVFYLGKREAKKRVVILGNSITKHGVCPGIGWYGSHGMAASCEEKDYVHVLYDLFTQEGLDCCMMINQVAEWERNFEKFDLKVFDRIRDFGADMIIFRCGENIVGLEKEEPLIKSTKKMIEYIRGKNSSVIFTTCFWENRVEDEAIRFLAKVYGRNAVELGDLGCDDAMKAKGLFEHSGVAAHPNDAGMKVIAERIFHEVKELLKSTEDR